MGLSDRDRAIIRAAVGPHEGAEAELQALTWASGWSLSKTLHRLHELRADREAWMAEPDAMRALADRARHVRSRRP